MAIITQIKAAVADLIDGADLSVPVTVTRKLVDPKNIEDLDSLRVVVLPEQLELNGATLKPSAFLDWGVRIWVQQRFDVAEQDAGAEVLFGLCEEIAVLLRPGLILDGIRARSTGVQMRPAFDPKMLDENGVFSSQIVVIFRLTRA